MTTKDKEPKIKKRQYINENNILKRKKLFDKLKSSLVKSKNYNEENSEEIEFLLRRL